MTKEEMKNHMEELEVLAHPIQEWIAKNYHPYMKITIDFDSVTLSEDKFRVIFKDV